MTSPGAAAFDFIHGTWTVHNRKLRDVTDPACDEWVEFDAARARPSPCCRASGTSTG